MKARKKGDRRVCRTRRQLSDALVGLLLEKRFDAITVQELIDRADVGRATFYAHYRDKEDLFLSAWKRVLDRLVAEIEWEGPRVPVRWLFAHLAESQAFYRALVRSRKTEWLFETGRAHLSESIEGSLARWLAGRTAPSAPVAVLANYLASEIVALLRWWLERERPHTPERMDEIFHELVVPGLRAALKGAEG
jgi:AcrR family transcriptional regulator